MSEAEADKYLEKYRKIGIQGNPDKKGVTKKAPKRMMRRITPAKYGKAKV
jgi:hypothetical protein